MKFSIALLAVFATVAYANEPHRKLSDDEALQWAMTKLDRELGDDIHPSQIVEVS